MHYIKGTGVVDVTGQKVCSKRQHDIRLARVYGHQGDLASLTRLSIESRASRQALCEAYKQGAQAKVTRISQSES